MMLVHHARSGADLFEDEPDATGADRYIWDPVADRVIDPIDDVVTARWAGPPGKLTAIFADGTAGLYDVTTHARVGPSYEFLDGQVTTFSRSADGSRLYFGYMDGRIQSFDSSTGTEIPPVIQTPGTIGTIAATTGGARVVATSFHNKQWSMTIHDGTTGEQLGEVPDFNAANIGPDGTLIAANIVGDIIEYDLNTLQPLGSLPGVRALVPVGFGGLQFSADGGTLRAGSHDGTTSIYDIASRTRLGDPIPGGGSLRADGMAVAFGSGDGIIIWDLDPEHLATAACRLAGRNLTPTEWSTHLSGLGAHRPTCPEYN